VEIVDISLELANMPHPPGI